MVADDRCLVFVGLLLVRQAPRWAGTVCVCVTSVVNVMCSTRENVEQHSCVRTKLVHIFSASACVAPNSQRWDRRGYGGMEGATLCMCGCIGGHFPGAVQWHAGAACRGDVEVRARWVRGVEGHFALWMYVWVAWGRPEFVPEMGARASYFGETCRFRRGSVRRSRFTGSQAGVARHTRDLDVGFGRSGQKPERPPLRTLAPAAREAPCAAEPQPRPRVRVVHRFATTWLPTARIWAAIGAPDQRRRHLFLPNPSHRHRCSEQHFERLSLRSRSRAPLRTIFVRVPRSVDLQIAIS